MECRKQHKEVNILEINCVKVQSAYAGNGEHVLNNQRAGEYENELAENGREDNDHRVTHCVTEDRLTLGKALGSCKQHKFACENLRELGTGKTCIARNRAQAQSQDSGHHRAEHIPSEIVRTSVHI